jgi:hypothetical protein
LALKHRHYGYRRIGALLRREGWQANHSTHPVKAAEMGVDTAASMAAGGDYAAAFASRARLQFQGRSSSIRLAG